MHKGRRHRKLLMTKAAIRRRRKYHEKKRLFKRGVKCLNSKKRRAPKGQRKLTSYYR